MSGQSNAASLHETDSGVRPASPTDLFSYYKEGECLLASGEYDEAIALFKSALRALLVLEDSTTTSTNPTPAASTTLPSFTSLLLLQPIKPPPSLLSTLLLNSSACLLPLSQPLPALRASMAASAIDPDNSKAWYRSALALDQLGVGEAAAWAMEKAISCGEYDAATKRKFRSSLTASGKGNSQSKIDMCSKDEGGVGEELASLLSIAKALAGFDVKVVLKKAEPIKFGLNNTGKHSSLDGTPGTGVVRNGDVGSLSKTLGEALSLAGPAKEAGNTFFKNGDFSSALRQYQMALQALLPLSTLAATFLAKQADSSLLVRDTHYAAWRAAAALQLDPTQEGPWHCLCNSLLALQCPHEANAVAINAMKQHPQNLSLTALQNRVLLQAFLVPLPASVYDQGARTGNDRKEDSQGDRESKGVGGGRDGKSKKKSSREEEVHHLSEREMREMSSVGVVAASELSRMNDQFAALDRTPAYKAKMKSVGLGSMIDLRVARYHLEVLQAEGWPFGCDKKQAMQFLLNSHEHSRNCGLEDFSMLHKETGGVDPMHMVMRLGDNTAASLNWLKTAPIGSFREGQRQSYGYGSTPMYHSFCNVPARGETLTPGTTHVAVGFNDLGDLAAAVSKWPSVEDLKKGGSGPLRWVGYDMSPYCVAKTLVIKAMMEGGAKVDEILQVWFSSSWSSPTNTAFLTAAAHASDSPEAKGCGAEAVQLLRYWAQAKVSLTKARSQWLEAKQNNHAWMGNFTRKVDRVSVCQYAMTGDLGQGTMGSTCMFAVPGQYGERAMDESFLNTISIKDLVSTWKAGNTTDSIITHAKSLLETRITALTACVREGLVKLEVKLDNVSWGRKGVQREIHGLQPHTMSWSNVPEYMPTKDFHSLARACSSPSGTTHVMHTMNWPKDVKGASFMDYKPTLGHKEGLKILIRVMNSVKQEVLPSAYKALGLDQLLLLPPIDYAHTIIDHGKHREMHESWVKHWFRSEVSQGAQYNIVEAPTYSVISRSNNTMHLRFSYMA